MPFAVTHSLRNVTGWGESIKFFFQNQRKNLRILGLYGKHDNVECDGVKAVIAWLVVKIIASRWYRRSKLQMQSHWRGAIFDKGLLGAKLIIYFLMPSLRESGNIAAKRSLNWTPMYRWLIHSIPTTTLEKLNNLIFITASDPTYNSVGSFPPCHFFSPFQLLHSSQLL